MVAECVDGRLGETDDLDWKEFLPNEQSPGAEAKVREDAAFADTRGGLIVYCRAGQWRRGWRLGQGIPLQRAKAGTMPCLAIVTNRRSSGQLPHSSPAGWGLEVLGQRPGEFAQRVRPGKDDRRGKGCAVLCRRALVDANYRHTVA